MIKKYRPSSATEGDWFMGNYCFHCKKERWTHFQEEGKEEDKCGIFSRALIFDVDDKDYPTEWQYNDEDNTVKCTAYEYKDWETTDSENAVPFIDANQLNLFGN